uniref:3-dehydrosphinganine reductase n=1 Tax=Bionectria ochroleuca TaxID=29856 RepID=A0A8H7NQ38_BIOOC
MFSSNAFEVLGRTAIITGGSSGMGLELARQLAAKGANIVIVARRQDRLLKGLEIIEGAALDKKTQRFHQISADLTVASEAVRIVDEVTSWNGGLAPDIVWCCAGCSHPTLFIDTPVEEFSRQMDSNYFSAMYVAHAIMSRWLKNPEENSGSSKETTAKQTAKSARHLLFTSSVLAFHTFAGYTSYSPTKAALRTLSDTLSQELNLYHAAHPDMRKVRVHTVFPSGILTEALDEENKIKSDVTKALEEVDKPLTPEVVVSRSLKALEGGDELIAVDPLSWLTKRSMLGGTARSGISVTYDWLLAAALALVMIYVRWDMDKQVRAFGRKFGATGMKDGGASSA